MATGGILGNGTKVGYSANSPVTFTAVANVLEVEFPSQTPDKIDKTVHSTSKFKKNMPGMVEVGDLVVRCLGDMDEATSPSHEALWDMADAQSEQWFRVEIPTNRAQTRWRPFEIYGYVADVRPGVPIEDKQTIEFVIVSSDFGITRYNSTNTSAIS